MLSVCGDGYQSPLFQSYPLLCFLPILTSDLLLPCNYSAMSQYYVFNQICLCEVYIEGTGCPLKMRRCVLTLVTCGLPANQGLIVTGMMWWCWAANQIWLGDAITTDKANSNECMQYFLNWYILSGPFVMISKMDGHFSTCRQVPEKVLPPFHLGSVSKWENRLVHRLEQGFGAT